VTYQGPSFPYYGASFRAFDLRGASSSYLSKQDGSVEFDVRVLLRDGPRWRGMKTLPRKMSIVAVHGVILAYDADAERILLFLQELCYIPNETKPSHDTSSDSPSVHTVPRTRPFPSPLKRVRKPPSANLSTSPPNSPLIEPLGGLSWPEPLHKRSRSTASSPLSSPHAVLGTQNGDFYILIVFGLLANTL
jgi:hypothetical protein